MEKKQRGTAILVSEYRAELDKVIEERTELELKAAFIQDELHYLTDKRDLLKKHIKDLTTGRGAAE